MPVHSSPLGDLTVLDLSTTLPGAQATQFLADAGAEVILVEPPRGHVLRRSPGWPALARHKRSIVLDLHQGAGHEELQGLLAGADVVVDTMRPQAAHRLGLTADELTQVNPRLVSASITGWGNTGPLAGAKGYEALIMAKSGAMSAKRGLKKRPGPAYFATPYASWAAAHSAVQGILAALLERESSGLGQRIEADLLRGLMTLEPYNWFYEVVLQRYPDAYARQAAPFDEQGRPQARLIYALLIAATHDGSWLQFAQVQPRLMQAILAELDLFSELAKPEYAGFPDMAEAEARKALWATMLERVSRRSMSEWNEVFDTNPNIFAETFRHPQESLDHPQLVHEGRSAEVAVPGLGLVRQPSTLVHVDAQPLRAPAPPPILGADQDEVRARLSGAHTPEGRQVAAEGGPRTLPLEGLTILEFGVMYAGPFGATLLTDLGARVIKVEPLDGDNLRTVVAFPEAGGAKVTQGKESIALDLGTEEGLAIVNDLARHSDIVLQCFRAGAAERAGVDRASLLKVNPELVYVSAPGYGVDGPYGHRPAYAPSISAASGISLLDAQTGGVIPTSLEEAMDTARVLMAGSAISCVNADGIAAHGVGSTLLLGLLARRRGRALDGQLNVTMLGTASQAIIEHNVSYPGMPQNPSVDPDFYGLSALYRLYEAADGWVFLAAPAEKEWSLLVTALAPYVDLAANERFASAQSRADHDADLAEVLTGVFRRAGKETWERDLTAADVGCVVVAETNPEETLQSDEWFEAGYTVEAYSPIFEEHRRIAPATTFSRSTTKADGGCEIGQHTRSLLGEIGYDESQIDELVARKVVRMG